MVCKICGKQLPDGSSVCKYCGAKQRNPGTGSSPTRRYSKKGMARRRMINTALLGIIALLIVGILAGIVMSARSGGENSDDAQLSANKETNENNENNENPETEEPVVTPDEETEEPTEEEPEETDEPEEEEDPDAESEEPEETDDPEDSDEPDEPDESEDPEVTDEPEESDEPEEEQEEEPTETPDETPEETPETPVVIPTGNYTASINRTSVEASLNHYRILTVAINETLPAGVEVASVSFTSSNDAIVRTEVVDGEGRAWGVALGKATVTGTVTLSTGETASTTCEVTVVEYKEPPKETKPSGSSGKSYILSDSDSRVYSVSELNKLSDKQLRLARNEIYARHGRIFKDAELKAYFESKSWYKGTISPDKFDDSLLNATEKKNITNIQKAESD